MILQITNGCSWNKCSYCEMYTAPQKKFRPRPQAEVLAEIRAVAAQGLEPRRVFLADGDALVLSMRRLRSILQQIRAALPSVQRVSSYCLPSNLKNKSDDDLAELENLGLRIIYVGAESGDDEVLRRVDKGESYASTAAALTPVATSALTVTARWPSMRVIDDSPEANDTLANDVSGICSPS